MTLALTAENGAHSFDIALDSQSALDLRDAIFFGINLAPGTAIPSDGDPRIDRALPGFMFTCGPDHIRHPEPVEGGAAGQRYPLHGSLSSHPATDILYEEDDGEVVCSARIPVSLANGESAEMKRHWRADRKTGHITLDDVVTNTGARAWPPVAMYHINFNTRLFDAGTRLTGAMIEGGSLPWRFGEGDMTIFCVPAKETSQHGWADVAIGPIAALGGRTLHVRFRTDTLSHLQVWRNQSPGCHVLGIEPVSHRLAGRADLIASGEMTEFAPGEAVSYGLSFELR
ncbi:DUF4432 family protein [Rhizobium sp. GN54]|uniref:DUF4432 family protein n=1 Tax=Rhizobium sp. GN54 TaxID=2898150 RepID=UPI001E336447|nr:DUF4432 family protein [Rhizobium sp. GN54]MCD2181739.1 DUF4432 family protein [Rhizobium sp. GN54]